MGSCFVVLLVLQLGSDELLWTYLLLMPLSLYVLVSGLLYLSRRVCGALCGALCGVGQLFIAVVVVRVVIGLFCFLDCRCS